MTNWTEHKNSPAGGNQRNCKDGLHILSTLEYAEPILTVLPQNPVERASFFKNHDVHPKRGEYWGDGIPRDFSGRPYEPLSWGHVLIFGRR